MLASLNLPLLVVLLFVQYCAGGKYMYYVIPDDGDCPVNVSNTNCFSLSEYSANQSVSLSQSNSVFIFLNGTHYLPENQSLSVFNATNVVWLGQGSREQGFHETVRQSTVHIRCKTPNSSIAFAYGRNITIEGITVSGCGMLMNFSYGLEDAMKLSNRDDLLVINVTLTVLEVYLMQMKDFSIQNGSGYGMLVINGFDMVVETSSFAQNNVQVYHDNFQCTSCRGANTAFFFFPPVWNCNQGLANYTLELQSTNISLGVDALAPSPSISTGGGLTIYLAQGDTYAVSVKLDTVTSYGNSALAGANIGFIVTDLVVYYEFEMTNSVSTNANSVHKLPSLENKMAATYSHGCGLYVLTGLSTPINNTTCQTNASFSPPENPIIIKNCVFAGNVGGYGAGAHVELFHTLPFDGIVFVNFTNTSFTGNIGDSCAALYLQSVNSGLGMPAAVMLEEVTVQDSQPLSNRLVSQSSLCADSLYGLVLKECKLYNNSGTGLNALNSRIVFTSDNYFLGNVGNNGGGLSIYGNSFFVLQFPVFINFSDNHAINFGGGIYVDEKSYFSEYCFFQIVGLPSSSQLSAESVLFTGNTADLAGSVLYGGRIDGCQLLPSTLLRTLNSTVVFDTIFNFSSQTGDSVISSQAIRVCFCEDGLLSCESNPTSMKAYAGQDLSLSVVPVGQRNGTTPGAVLVEEYIDGAMISSTAFIDDTGCRQLSYTIQSPPGETSTVLYLSVFQPSLYDRNLSPSKVNVSVKINVEPCPLGFQETSTTDSSCGCSNTLLEATSGNITCNDTTLDVTTYGGVWVGYDEAYGCVLAYDSCPFDYCQLNTELTFSLNDPDAQCRYNRSGLLCGGCSANLSSVLGSNNCLPCTDDYLMLIIPFALAGVALVVLLIGLNLTVSVGTINGLVFYANIVLVSKFIFFAEGPIPFLTTFISWINLDLGIETCFYDGMDGYDKMWFQFVFPVYIWIMMGVLAVLARHSTRFSNLLGTNVVPVLSTLLLLSCMKLYRTIVQSFGIPGKGKIGCNESSSFVVWYVDPNIQYFDSSHIYLLVAASIFLAFVLVPYTFILLLSPLLEHLALKYTCCKFWGKLKYFFDAYNAPYKDKYRFWTGFLLLTRLVVMLVISFANYTTILATIVLSVALILTVLASLGGVYRNHYLDILECCFLLDLMFMSACAISGHTRTGAYIGLSVAFVIFFGIVLFHTYLCVKQIVEHGHPTKVYEVIRHQRSILEDPLLTIEGTITNFSRKTKPIHTTTTVNAREDSCSIEVIRRRESLLRDNTEETADHYRKHNSD